MADNRTLAEIRQAIDEIDPKIRELLMERLDCSGEVATAKLSSGDNTIYRPDREEEILRRLGTGVPEERLAGYLAVVRKIMETSRMYQYGIIYDKSDGIFEQLVDGIGIPENASRVKIRIVRPDRPGSMSAILSMIGDYGYDMAGMDLVGMDHEEGTAVFVLTICGDLNTVLMRKLMFQLSMECMDFRILEVL